MVTKKKKPFKGLYVKCPQCNGSGNDGIFAYRKCQYCDGSGYKFIGKVQQ